MKETKDEEIYILIHVTYDRYRFQNNVYATTSKELLDEYIKEHWLEDDVYDTNSDNYNNLRNDEKSHYIIEVF